MADSDIASQIFGTLAPGYSPWGAVATAGLGALSSLGSMGASRLPYTTMQVVGNMAAGGQRQLAAQRQAQIQAQQAQMGALQLGLVKRKMDWLSQLFGGSPGNSAPFGNISGNTGAPSVGAAGSVPLEFKSAASPSGTNGTSGSGSSSAASPVMASGSPQSTGLSQAAPSSAPPLPFPNATPVQNAMMMEMLVPGSGKGIVDHYFQGPTDLQRALTAGGIDPGSPMGQRLLSLGAAKAAGVTSGYQIGPNGQESPVAGGDADPRVLAAQQGAEAWAKAPAQAWQASMEPRTLRGPGSLYVNPYLHETVQVPNEINYIDPNTLAEKKAFVPLGVQVSGFPGGPGAASAQGAPPLATPAIPGSARPGAGGTTGTPSGAGATGGAQVAAPSPATAPGVPGTAGETSFMTEAPPGQKEIVEGAAKNYSEEGRKSYESAVDLKSSIAFIKRDLQTMGPQGFTAVGSGAELRGQFARAVNTAALAAGSKPIFDPNKVGAWEDFEKEATLGGMKGLATIFGGSREAASIVHTSMSAFPHPGNSYQGARLLVNAFDEAANREIDQRNFETNWIATHGGNLTGAIESFNSQYPAASYSQRAISVVQPIKVTQQSDIKSLFPGTRVLTPDGKVRLIPGTPGVQLNMQAPNG